MSKLPPAVPMPRTDTSCCCSPAHFSLGSTSVMCQVEWLVLVVLPRSTMLWMPSLVGVEQGSASRQLVSPGYFSAPLVAQPSQRWSQVVCPAGSYCREGLATLCPPGTYGSSTGSSTPWCNGFGSCSPGFYCPAGSTSPAVLPCASNHPEDSVYCPAGAGTPTQALPGEVTTGGTNRTRTGVAPCPPGRYCVGGRALLCPAGRFGCSERLSDVGCNGPCTRGFYCPEGSNSSQQ